MTSPSQVTDGEMSQFKGLLTNAGLTAEIIRAAIDDHEVAKAMVSGGKAYLDRGGTDQSTDEELLTVFVSYQLPSYNELNGSRFDWASDLFSSKYKWEEHESVRGQVDRTAGNRDFLVKEFTEKEIKRMGGLTSDNVIAWAVANGYRAPVLEETVDFAKAHPDLQREYPIVALGSFALSDGSRGVAILCRDDAERSLDYDWFDAGWLALCRFLLVRK